MSYTPMLSSDNVLGRAAQPRSTADYHTSPITVSTCRGRQQGTLVWRNDTARNVSKVSRHYNKKGSEENVDCQLRPKPGVRVSQEYVAPVSWQWPSHFPYASDTFAREFLSLSSSCFAQGKMPKNKKSLRILIVGAGLGGLGAGLALQSDGHHVAIVDSVPVFTEVILSTLKSNR